ncbi:MAG: ankyrin repeat domain-containing protein [Bacteroidales bacterium]|nr:ankyrin repeat domain-containing protein [Candidatus Latescibacterota bacterium]
MRKILFSLTLIFSILALSLPLLAGDIHTAIQDGDVARVKAILKADPDAINESAENRFKELPIHMAAQTGNVEIARILIEAGADVDAGDSDNSTALGIAAMRKHIDMANFLLEQGANINHRDRKADTPLSFALYGSNEEMIQLLLDAGADLYFRSPEGETLLHRACQRGVLMMVEHLLESGADLDAQEQGGATPLGYAALSTNADIVKMLLEKGADPNPPTKEGHASPLIFATWRDAVDCARLLLEKDADTEVRAHGGMNPLMNAADRCSIEMLDLLIEHGAKVNKTGENGETALMLAAANGKAEHVAALLKAGEKPDLGKDKGGRTALQLAAIRGYKDVADQLIEAGADIDNNGTCGTSPIQFAGYYGNTDVVDLLNSKGARSGGKIADRSLAGIGKLGKKEAAIYFLNHSGWAVKTRNHLLIFDYFKNGEDPDQPGFCNGTVNPSEFADEKVVVFASHHHGDHYWPGIFEWSEQVEDITYFLGHQPTDTVPAYTFMPERMEEQFGDIKLTTIHSTDAGVGMLIEVDGLTIFHAGDHANGRIGLMGEFTDEIDFLEENCPRPDILFMGIRGCSLGRPDEVKEGIEYTLGKMKPKVFFPMHATADGEAYMEFIDSISSDFKKIQMVAPGNRGDHFIFKKGKIIDPRPFDTRLASKKKDAGCAENKDPGCENQ